MPRYPILTAPIYVDAKQDPVLPIPSPQPTRLTPPPDFIPYGINVDDKQPLIDPIQSAMAQQLFGLILRNYQQPPPVPAATPSELPPAPQSGPDPSQRFLLSSPFATPPAIDAPPIPAPPGTQPQILMSTVMRQPMREFAPPPATTPQPWTPPDLATPPTPAQPTYTAPQQILRAIGFPQSPQTQQSQEAHVARTFPKATNPVTKQVSPSAPTPPPKALRTNTGTVATTLDKVSPLRQDAAPTGRRIVVSLPDKKVVVYDRDGSILRQYSAYLGRASTPTPKGQFRIMENIKPAESEWYYGGHWMGFARDYDPKNKSNVTPYAGFHGWVYDKQDDEIERNEPGWKTTTGGCVQLGNKDVADLAALIGAGDPVSILDTPFTPPPPRPPRPPVPAAGILNLLQNLMPR